MTRFRTGRRRDGSKYRHPISNKSRGKRIGRDVLKHPRPMKVVVPTKHVSSDDYFKKSDIGKAMLKDAVIYGLSATVPAFGAVAIPVYIASNYLTLGKNLCNIYDELIAKRQLRRESIVRASESLGEFSTERSADEVASAVVAKAGQIGLFGELAKKTSVKEVVFAEMLKGSISSALSTIGGELATFAIGKVLGT